MKHAIKKFLSRVAKACYKYGDGAYMIERFEANKYSRIYKRHKKRNKNYGKDD